MKLTKDQREQVLEYLGEGIHTAFRKGAPNSDVAHQIWKLIDQMPDEDWERVIQFAGDPVIDFVLELLNQSCPAKLWHGPGHQSSTRCEVKGAHILHRVVYGENQQEATWTGIEAMTGFFDEPPEEER